MMTQDECDGGETSRQDFISLGNGKDHEPVQPRIACVAGLAIIGLENTSGHFINAFSAVSRREHSFQIVARGRYQIDRITADFCRPPLKIVDIHSHGEASSLHKALLQYLVLLSVLRDEAKRL
jgi:hypothetical protein